MTFLLSAIGLALPQELGAVEGAEKSVEKSAEKAPVRTPATAIETSPDASPGSAFKTFQRPRKTSPSPKLQARDLPRSTLSITSSDGKEHRVKVEIAADPASRSRGLMFEESLPAGSGMLFVFEREEIQSFWMKNTPLPLDMLFINSKGRVVGIIENATPFSEEPRWVSTPSRYVLEVPGGWCSRMGIRTGNQVELKEALGVLEGKRSR